MDYDAIRDQIKNLERSDELQELIPKLQDRKSEIMEQYAVEDSKQVREQLLDESYEIKKVINEIYGKIGRMVKVRMMQEGKRPYGGR